MKRRILYLTGILLLTGMTMLGMTACDVDIDPLAGTETKAETDGVGSKTGAEADTDTSTGTETAAAAGTDTQTETETKTDTESETLSDAERVLTVENLTTLAKKNNIIVFVVDRFSNEYYHTAMEECPEIFDELTGFTFFDDYISLYPRTLPAIPHLVTGVENDFSLSRTEYFEKAYQEAPLMNALHERGFDINIYTDDYYGYDDATVMAAYTSNISDKGAGTADYAEFSTNMRAVYSQLTDGDLTLRDIDNGYAFIHISGCHLPISYDENFQSVSGTPSANDSTVAMKVSFKLINRYIQEMKRLGVYENATILILGDHCSIGSDTRSPYYAHITSLLVKPAGLSEGDIRLSHAPIAPEDIFATVLKAADAPLEDPAWRTVFEIGEDEVRTRRYLFQRRLDNGKYEEEVYEITGSGKNLENWNLVDVRQLDKSIYD